MIYIQHEKRVIRIKVYSVIIVHGVILMKLHEIYHPITAAPFVCNESYMEVTPCEALKPYVKCFWGTAKPYRKERTDIQGSEIVTPDTCMDIIFNIDFTNNKIDGKFCGIDNRSFITTYYKNGEEKTISSFAIRFYAWSAVLFAEESMRDTKNAFFDIGCHFSRLKKEIEALLFDVVCMEDRIEIVQNYLLSHIHPERNCPAVTEAVGEILLHKGTMEIGRLSKELHMSSRHLERLFRENMGISPKQLSSLVRYQYLWNDILYNPAFQIQDAVFQYGYTDQAHLMHEFKKFHTMNISEAKNYALRHVAFLQEKSF